MNKNKQRSSNIEPKKTKIPKIAKLTKISTYFKEINSLLNQYQNMKISPRKFEISSKIIILRILIQRREAVEKIIRNYFLYKERKSLARKKKIVVKKILTKREISCIKIQQKWRNYKYQKSIKKLIQKEKSKNILWINTMYPNELKIKIFFDDGTSSIKEMSYCPFRQFYYFYITKGRNKNENKKIRFQFLCKDKIYYNKIYPKIQLNGEVIQEATFGDTIFELENAHITPTKIIKHISKFRKDSTASTNNSDYEEVLNLDSNDSDSHCNPILDNKFIRRSKKNSTLNLGKHGNIIPILKGRNPNRKKTVTGKRMVKFGEVIFSY